MHHKQQKRITFHDKMPVPHREIPLNIIGYRRGEIVLSQETFGIDNVNYKKLQEKIT